MTNKNVHPQSGAIDEALLAAYRREDKGAVMDYLLAGVRGSLLVAIVPQLVIKGVQKGVAPRQSQMAHAPC